MSTFVSPGAQELLYIPTYVAKQFRKQIFQSHDNKNPKRSRQENLQPFPKDKIMST